MERGKRFTALHSIFITILIILPYCQTNFSIRGTSSFISISILGTAHKGRILQIEIGFIIICDAVDARCLIAPNQIGYSVRDITRNLNILPVCVRLCWAGVCVYLYLMMIAIFRTLLWQYACKNDWDSDREQVQKVYNPLMWMSCGPQSFLTFGVLHKFRCRWLYLVLFVPTHTTHTTPHSTHRHRHTHRHNVQINRCHTIHACRVYR